MKTFKEYLRGGMDKKDQKYFLDQAKKLQDRFDKWYDEAEIFCRELYDEGNLDDKATILMREIDDIEDKVRIKIKNIVNLIKKS